MRDEMTQRMQKKLDGVIEEQELEELLEYVAQDPNAAQEYEKLEQVDTMLARASHVRAPQRLAATIMARLAQAVKKQTDLEDLPDEIKQAVLLSLSFVILSTMPTMLTASWLVLNAHKDPALITRATERTIALLVMIIDALTQMLEEMEQMVRKDPKLAAVAMSLLPMALNGILETLALPTTPMSEENSPSDE